MPLANFSNATVAKIGPKEPVSLEVFDKICAAFNSQLGDMLEYFPDEKED